MLKKIINNYAFEKFKHLELSDTILEHSQIFSDSIQILKALGQAIIFLQEIDCFQCETLNWKSKRGGVLSRQIDTSQILSPLQAAWSKRFESSEVLYFVWAIAPFYFPTFVLMINRQTGNYRPNKFSISCQNISCQIKTCLDLFLLLFLSVYQL